MRLLRSALERGRSSLLTLTVGIITYLPALDLLVGHSKRWKTVYLSCPNTDLRYLRRVAGKLPFLDTLELNTWDTPSNSLDFFERVPRLRKLAVDMSSLSAISLPPLHRLRSFGILGISSTDAVSTVMSFMTRMPPTTQFRLQLFLSNWTDDDTLSVPQTSASITELSMELSDYCDGEHCVQALGDIFAAVTLPCLRELAFNSMEYPYSLMHWAHTPFLGLSKRSEFHTRLQSLRLCHVVITETELLAALAALPVLQQLEIADHDCIQNVPVTLHLLTDTLFSRLTLDPNQPSLVPDLRSLICHSLLQFNDNTYLALLLSRRGHSPPFVNRMSWLEGHNRELDPLVMARLHELQRRGELFCEFSSADLTY
ncbi:hypothetical protein C8R43DRAFT_1126936 [Mycena crocata]|nr:hypothetical protein C8R43DRAFT_1126936 [Mycena crocata]